MKSDSLKREKRNDFNSRYKCHNCKEWKNDCTTICIICFKKYLAKAKLETLKEELEWMEKQIVSRHPIDFYNRAEYLKQKIKVMKK
jgi:hypothetical protein